MTPLAMARRLLARGFAPIPVPAGTKAPVVKGWQALRLTAAELPAAFGNGANIGLLNGAPSNNLADTDLDAPEALAFPARSIARIPTFIGLPRVSGKSESPSLLPSSILALAAPSKVGDAKRRGGVP